MEEKRLTTFSIVVAVSDQAKSTADNLPVLLNQQYDEDGSYEVIVVDVSSTDNTVDLLDHYKTEYRNLYTTFVPTYHFQRDRRRLALTIGAKAAKNEWIVFADITKVPKSADFLSRLSSVITTDLSVQLILGNIKRKTDNVRLKSYIEIGKASSRIRRVEQNSLHLYIPSLLRHDYDFIVVRHDKVHELLKFFETTKLLRI